MFYFSFQYMTKSYYAIFLSLISPDIGYQLYSRHNHCF
ncbi:hypothetical protein [Klebsiella pneumoniae IS43]|uniref:Uncharacterized protein n=1 Tax=Klebsiella pneumoniae IS43 TaxID=1432552 RepID=W1DNU8_KLEPN|nr:hypothetical protein [Klebsiella pneumoniae IS43]